MAMASTKLNTPAGGGVIIQPASNIAADVTVNVPSQNCTLGIQGPAFRVSGGAQALSTNVFTKVILNNEQFDTNGNFDTTTNYRFTPTVAGYYQFNGQISNNAVVTIIPAIYKNGSLQQYGCIADASSSNGNNISVVSDLIYMNGSTDYVELYCSSIGAPSNIGSNMSGFLVRAA